MAEELFIPQLGQTVEEVTIISFYVKDGDAVKQGQEILEVETDKAVFDVEATADGFIHFGPNKIGDIVPVLAIVAMIGEKDETFAVKASVPTAIESVSSTPAYVTEDLFIPQLGQTVEEVTLINWYVKDGDRVKQGQEVIEVETDKAVFDVEATADGTIHFGPFKIGDVIPVLTVIAVIGDKEAKFTVQEKAADQTVKTPAAESIRNVRPAAPLEKMTNKSEKLFASPRARKLASQKSVDLTMVTPTGGNGIRVTEADVLGYLSSSGKDAAPLPSVEITDTVPMKGIRGIIAERMAASAQTTARVTLFMDVDATAFSALREKLKAEKESEWGFKPGYNDLLAKACSIALQYFPNMNARINDDQIEHLSQINIGIAVDNERGLYVPVIRDVNHKNLQEIGDEFRQHVDEIRSGKILPETLSGGTFTITNLGMYDVDGFTPVINLPEAAILGVGRILDKAVVIDGEITVRKMMVLSLAFDHRLVDGAPAAKFMQYLKDMIESPNDVALTE